ncbi:MAG: glycosyltransferase family 39 protein [Caldilineaceae bacterium]|nr:glycosyltransferase family 39 protein [Caldilineaceae bacterium]
MHFPFEHSSRSTSDRVSTPTFPWIRPFLLLLLLAAYAVRVHGLTTQSLWRDEVDAVYFALRDLPETLSMFTAMAQNGPLYFLILRVWFMVAGAGPFALRYLSVCAGTLAIVLTWQVARRLLGSVTSSHIQPSLGTASLALLAALLMAINPYQFWYSQEGKMYALITMFALLAHWLWLRGMTQGGRRTWFFYLLTVSFSIYSHLLMIMLIPLHMVWFLIAWPQSRSHWRGYGLALAGLTLPYLPLLVWQWPMLLASEPKTGFTFTPLTSMVETLAMSHSYGLLPPAPWLQLTPILFLALAGLLFGSSVMSPINAGETASVANRAVPSLSAWRRHALLVSWGVVPVLTIYLLSLRQPVYTDRYVIWIAPAVMMLIALGLRAVYVNAGRLAVPLTGLLLLYLVGFWLVAVQEEKQTTIKYELRGGVHYVAERRAPDTLLILQIPHLEWSYRYYTSDFTFDLFADSDARLGRWATGLWTNGGLADEEARAQVDHEMRAMTHGEAELWLLSSEVEMWDARHLMREWLDAHGRIVDKAEFHGVQARHYVLDPPAPE